MNSRETVMLTGGTGFLGSHILRRLVETDRYRIVLLKRSFSDCSRINELMNPNVIIYDIDIVPIDNIFRDNHIDVIIHTATEYGRQGKRITEILDTNMIFPLSLIEMGLNQDLQLFINTDSFFNKDNFSYSNLLDYSLSKKSLNIWLKYLADRIKVANMRLEHVYGEYDSRSKFVEDLVQKIAIEKVSNVDLTYGHQRRDFVYIDDVVDAYIAILDSYHDHFFRYKIFEVGTGNSVQVCDFVKSIKELSGSDTLLSFGSIPYRHDEIMDSKADSSEMKNLGWSTKYDYVSGIRKILTSYGV